MVRILADTNLGQTVQGGVAKRTELHTDGGTCRIVEPCQEIGERSENAHHIHGHELLDGINVLDEGFDDGNELDHKTEH